MARVTTSARADLRRAFTLIELLVVIAIIGVLVGLLLPVLSMVRLQARVTGTLQRMQQVVVALGDYASGDRTVAALQCAADLGGPSQLMAWQTVRISLPAGSVPPPALGQGSGALDALRGEQILEVLPPAGFVVPAASWWTDRWAHRWPETDWMTLGSVPPLLPYPWGRPGLCIDLQLTEPGAGTGATGRRWGNPAADVLNRYVIGNATGSELVAATRSITRSDGTAEDVTGDQPYPFDLGQASPLRTVELLRIAGLLAPGAAGVDQYADDRDPSRAWNDLWGNPLIISYAVFHPTRDANHDLRDRYVKAAAKQYGYTRAVYVTVGATGLQPRAGIAADAATAESLRDRWLQIRDTCRAHEWTERAFAAPPSDWREMRKGEQTVAGQREICLLLAPIELKP